ncbi:MAG: glycosyltransferase family 4 protein [Anaerolineae bacterium]
MRLLYVIVGYGAEHIGYEMHREIAQEIMARGHSYTIWALTHSKHMRNRTPETIEDGIPIVRAVCAGPKYLDLINRLATPIFKFPWFLTALSRLVAFLWNHRDYDLVIAEGAFPIGAIVYLATRIVRLPFIMYINGADFIANQQANYGYARYALVRWFLRRAYQSARLLKAESPYGAESTIALGCPPEKMTLVQRNIGRCCYPPEDRDLATYRRQARERVGAAFHITAPRLILASGRLLPIKGFDLLIRALPHVVERAGDVQVLFLGPNRVDTRLGNYQQVLTQLAQELGVADRIVFAGSVAYDQVRDFVAAADVVAIPSRQDSGNKLVMEAAAVATPFVATHTAGNARWAPEWDCGLIINPEAVQEMADGLVRLLCDPVAARRMGQNGLRFAAMFHPARVAERTLWLCECAVQRESPPQELREFNTLLHPNLS